ncbi:MAG: PrsW family intramembrane metalloprotease [Planctomycetota bacterium]|nr:MAG: PrsW family intramembrane metalloprotease [Planctomycetota bacterium]
MVEPPAESGSTAQAPPAPAPPPAAFAPPAAPGAAPAPAPNILRDLRTKLFKLLELPEIDDVPIRHILLSGFTRPDKYEPAEETFAVGTPRTTPPLAQVATEWPRPRVYWHILLGTLLVYFLLRLGFTSFENINFLPGTLVVGAFLVPLAVVVFFFEMNTPKNVSVYQVGKMLLFGGTLGLIATLVIADLIRGSGTGELVPALLTGVIEETGKLTALLLIAGNARYPWILNGLLFGAAVGAGFAGFESSGYAFVDLFGSGDLSNISLRAFLAPFGHVIWTGMIGAALWKVRGKRPFEFGMLLHPTVVKRWLVAVILHGLWDTRILHTTLPIQQIIIGLVGWLLIFAILKEGLSQVAAESKAGAAPPAPA